MMKLNGIQKAIRVFNTLTWFGFSFILVFCNLKKQESKPCPSFESTNFAILFQRGFEETPISFEINGKIYFEGRITTDMSIELAKLFEFAKDSISTMSVTIDGKQRITLCPYNVVSINYLNDSIIVNNLEKPPVLE